MNSRAAALGVALAGAALAVAAGQANATLFSFAANTNTNPYTLAGTAGGAGGAGSAFSITDFSRPNTYTLLVDDNNGPLPSISIPVELRVAFTASNGQNIVITPNVLYQHTYRVTGTFGFYDMMGNAIMTANIGSPGDTTGASGAVMSVPGGLNTWSTAGAIVGNDQSSVMTYTFMQGLVNALGGASTAAQYGLSVGSTTSTGTGINSFGFTMSTINNGTMNAQVALDANGVPTGTWRSSSSFSGATGTIPAPGAAALLGIGGLIARRRRR